MASARALAAVDLRRLWDLLPLPLPPVIGREAVKAVWRKAKGAPALRI